MQQKQERANLRGEQSHQNKTEHLKIAKTKQTEKNNNLQKGLCSIKDK